MTLAAGLTITESFLRMPFATPEIDTRVAASTGFVVASKATDRPPSGIARFAGTPTARLRLSNSNVMGPGAELHSERRLTGNRVTADNCAWCDCD